MRSIPLTVTRSQIVFLKKRLLGFGVEEVHPAGVEAELDTVPWRHAHARVDPGRDLVAPDLPIEELVRAEPLDHVDLHVEGRRAVGYAVGDRLRPEPDRALLRAHRLAERHPAPRRPGGAIGHGARSDIHARSTDGAGA